MWKYYKTLLRVEKRSENREIDILQMGRGLRDRGRKTERRGSKKN